MKKFDFIVYLEDNVYIIVCVNFSFIHTYAKNKKDIHKNAIDVSELMADSKIFKINKDISSIDVIEQFSVIVDNNKGRIEKELITV